MALLHRSWSRIGLIVVALGVALSPFPPGQLLRTHGANIPLSLSATSSDRSATATYTLVFTPQTAISGSAVVKARFFGQPGASFGITGAAVASGSATVFQSVTSTETGQFGDTTVSVAASSLPAQALTLKLSGITNPSRSGNYGFQFTTLDGTTKKDESGAQISIGSLVLSGTVRLPNATPVNGVYVEATDTSDPSKRFGGGTGPDGVYGIGDLTSGKSYKLNVYLHGGDSSLAGFTSPDPVTVTYAGTTLTQNLTLKLATKTISGTIKRSNGSAVSGGKVAIFRTDGAGTFFQATTNGSGQYSATVGGGKYEVRPDTFAGPGQTAPDYAYSGPGARVAFSENETTEAKTGIDFTVATATATIKGSVTPDPGMTGGVGVFSQGGPGIFTGTQNGAFELKVPAGTYQLEFGQDPMSPGDKYALPSIAPITVADGETKNVGTITLVKMDKIISATVRDKDTKIGIQGFGVGCFRPSGGGFAMAQTNSAGVATVKVTEGEWGCMAMAGFGKEGGGGGLGLRNLIRFVERAHAASGDQAKYVVQGGPRFVKLSGSTAATLTFDAVKADRTISVAVTDANGAAISEYGFVEAELVTSDKGSDFGHGGGLGSPIDPNSPGLASLNVPAGVYDLRMMTPPGSSYSSGDSTRVDVRSGNASAQIKLLANDATVSGTLKDEDGATVKGVFAFVTATNKKGAFIPGDVNTANGTYTMRVPSAGGELSLGYFVEPSSGYFPQPFGESKVTPSSGQTVSKDIVMKKATVTINLTVKDPDGNVVKGALVEADNRAADGTKKVDSLFHNGAETDASGKVTLRVPAGDFTFRAFLAPETLRTNKWLPPKGTTVTLAKGDTKDVTLTFQKADVTLKGKVTTSDGTTVADAFVTVYSDSGETIIGTTSSTGEYSLNIAKGAGWHVIAEKDDTTASGGTANPLLSSDVAFDTGSETTITKNLTLEDQGTLSSAVSSTFDTDNAKLVNLTDGDLKGAQVSVPADALDTDNQGSNATITVETTVEVPRELSDKPLGNIALDVTATSANGSSITSLTSSSTAITIPVEQGDLTAAGFSTSDIGTNVTMSYYDETSGQWTALEGSVTGTLKDNTGDGDTSDATDLVLVTANTNHFTAFAVTAAVDTTPPNAPTNVAAADAKSGGAVTLSWTNPTNSDFAKIRVYRSTTSGSTGSAVTTIDSKTTTSFTDTGLTDGTAYFYTVRALDTSGNESTNTAQVSATPSKKTLPKTGRGNLLDWLRAVVRPLVAVFGR